MAMQARLQFQPSFTRILETAGHVGGDAALAESGTQL
jgi:hypothetical protein